MGHQSPGKSPRRKDLLSPLRKRHRAQPKFDHHGAAVVDGGGRRGFVVDASTGSAKRRKYKLALYDEDGGRVPETAMSSAVLWRAEGQLAAMMDTSSGSG